MMPLVSVVMAAKNYARFLPEAVDSVRNQTISDWELLIVDDGSTDATPEVVAPYLADPRVRYYRSDRLGQSRAKNLGIGLARGEWIAFLDADDSWLPTKLERQLSLVRDRANTGVVYCRRLLMDETGTVIPTPLTSTQHPFSRGQVLPQLYLQNFVCFSSAMVRRAVFSQVGAFDPDLDLAVDYDLWLRVARHHVFDYVDEELVYYRTGHGNLSKKLADRVAIALSIMHRAESRHCVGDTIPREVVSEGYASTCRTLGYVIRPSEPIASVRWYLRALRWPTGRLTSVKGLIRSLLAILSRKRIPGSAENASVNQ